MFNLCSQIQIEPGEGGNVFSFRAVNEVVIRRSIYELTATARIRIPVTAVVRQKDGSCYPVETVKQIGVGDKISIRLGYNDRLRTEFNGYISKINMTKPLEIECEDHFYPFRSRNVTLSGKTTLAEILDNCGLEVAFCEEVAISNFAIPNKPVSAVLNKLQTDYGLNIFFDLDGKLYAARSENIAGETVNYTLRYNVIDEDRLEFNRAEDRPMNIKAVCFKKNGQRLETVVGPEEATQRTLYFYDVTDMTELKLMAETELKRHCFDGFRGQMTTFLEPYAFPAMVARIKDPHYPEQDGEYYIESVETTFGLGGARRNIEIGIKV